MDEFTMYESYYRRGIFARCNGLEMPNMADWDEPAVAGYLDGLLHVGPFAANDNQPEQEVIFDWVGSTH